VFNFLWIPTMGYMGSAWAKLLCYGGMMVAGWYFGQRYFPVRYPLGRMALYVALAIGLWWLGESLAGWLSLSPSAKIGANTGLLLCFIGTAWGLERRGLAAMK
jgi:hypothetical protein